VKNAESTTAAALSDLRSAASLSERESELVRRAGERVFTLSRKLAAAEKEIERLRSELRQAHVLVDEVRTSRDVLSSQVASLLGERDREYQERAELRRLMASLQSQMQEMLSGFIASQAAPRGLLGRAAPQRSGHVPMALLSARRD
jgi:chromosome segregation ATPase